MSTRRSSSVLRILTGVVAVTAAVAWMTVSLARAASRVKRRVAARLSSAQDKMAARQARLRSAPPHRRALRRASSGAMLVLLWRAPRWLAARWLRASS